MTMITAALVKELREKTGAGMMDCKTALQENAGDMTAATDWLRAKGLSKAAKKSGRIAADGLVAAHASGTRGALVEVNSETDFVARNEVFQSLVGHVASLALQGDGTPETLLATVWPGEKGTVEQKLTDSIATIGENISLRRCALLKVSRGVVADYVHAALKPGMGKIAVLVALESEGDVGVLQETGRQLAMHVAAARPEFLDRASVDPTALARERAILVEQSQDSGRPADVIEKMVEGRIRKYYEESCLLDQVFVVDGKSRVSDVLAAAAKKAGAPIRLAAFLRFELGEGIEKKQGDFAAEVAAARG